jgi:hypothetical protein
MHCLFGITFILYLLELSAGKGFTTTWPPFNVVQLSWRARNRAKEDHYYKRH